MGPRPLVFVVALLVFSVLAPQTASAQDNRPYVHDRGFFLRLSAGLGYAATEAADVEFNGFAGDGNFAIGAIVSPGLALHGTLLGWSVTEPDVEVGSFEGEADDVTTSMSGVGAGLTYYLLPSNVYFSGSLCAATLRLEADFPGALTVTTESGTGIAIDLGVGKEWWVGKRWGLGLTGGLGFHSIAVECDDCDQDTDENWSGANYTVRFSATYN